MPDFDREVQDLAIADGHIADGMDRLRNQTRLAARLPDGSRERTAASELVDTLQSSLEHWERHRQQILHLLDPVEYPPHVRENPRVNPNRSLEQEMRRRLLPDVRRWRLKARELRVAAAGIEGSVAGATFLRLSRDYELLAERTERRLERERRTKDRNY